MGDSSSPYGGNKSKICLRLGERHLVSLYTYTKIIPYFSSFQEKVLIGFPPHNFPFEKSYRIFRGNVPSDGIRFDVRKEINDFQMEKLGM